MNDQSWYYNNKYNNTIIMKSDIYYYNFNYYNFNHPRVIYIYTLIFGSFSMNKCDDFCRMSKLGTGWYIYI